MILAEQIFAQSLLLVGELEQHQTELLRTLCTAVSASLTARMRSGLTPEDCKADFVAAASLYALAALEEVGDVDSVEQLKLGDVTVTPRKSSTSAKCLRNQADMMFAPYLQDRFSFMGV